mgnify:CR=1 FL=1
MIDRAQPRSIFFEQARPWAVSRLLEKYLLKLHARKLFGEPGWWAGFLHGLIGVESAVLLARNTAFGGFFPMLRSACISA